MQTALLFLLHSLLSRDFFWSVCLFLCLQKWSMTVVLRAQNGGVPLAMRATSRIFFFSDLHNFILLLHLLLAVVVIPLLLFPKQASNSFHRV